MSIYIKGMKIPKCCDDCPFCDYEQAHCLAKGDKRTNEKRYEARMRWCPLIEVPPHGRLIDSDALMDVWNLNDAIKWGNKTAEQQAHSYNTMMMYEIANMIDDAPTIIPAETCHKES